MFCCFKSLKKVTISHKLKVEHEYGTFFHEISLLNSTSTKAVHYSRQTVLMKYFIDTVVMVGVRAKG